MVVVVANEKCVYCKRSTGQHNVHMDPVEMQVIRRVAVMWFSGAVAIASMQLRQICKCFVPLSMQIW